MSLTDCKVFQDVETFYADDERRRRSPEWDYGVHWQDGVTDWPRYRVSWVVETGDLYAVKPGVNGVLLLGNVPKVGEYPYTRTPGYNAWTVFKNMQPIEQVLAGWAEEPVQSLEWVLYRLAKWELEQ